MKTVDLDLGRFRLARAVEDRRTALKLPQGEAARRVGRPQQWWSLRERGGREISAPALVAFAAALETTPHKLLEAAGLWPVGQKT